MIKKLFPFLCLLLVTVVFFWQFLLKGLLPIPADTIIGLYHPYRDLYSENNPRGIPFKNFLITDPVRQEYPWRKLSIESFKKGILPIWNPYSFSGTPNIANLQSAAFYPLNVLFGFLPFEYAWSLLIMLSPLLAGIFLYIYLRNLKLDRYSSFLGSAVFAFSGFFTTWLEWGTILHVALWLPLSLLSIDKLSEKGSHREIFGWSLALVLSLSFAFFAGHLQTFFYSSLIIFAYFLFRFLESVNKKTFSIKVFIPFAISLILTLPQLLPTFNFISLSARGADRLLFQTEGWFIPWQHLIQFVSPDFFGNPATLNYWGVWNYGELTGYVGIAALILSIYALFFRRDKNVLFFGTVLFLSLIFSLPTIFAKLPYVFNLPFISTAQPTRLLFLIDFSLSILSAYGLNQLIKTKKLKEILIPVIGILVFFAALFIFVFIGNRYDFNPTDIAVAKRNLIFPLLVFASSSILLIAITKSNKKITGYLLAAIILLTIFDLFRFSWKFNTFSKKEYLFPVTKSLTFIQKNIGNYRIAGTDPGILAPNFSIMHGIASVEGYDPLFSQRYGEFISAINRKTPDINPPFGFNRIVRLENISSNLVDLLGVKYVLSLTDVSDPKFEKVFEEGEIKVYENKDVLPKAFFVNSIKVTLDKQDTIDEMFDSKFNPKFNAVVEENIKRTVFTAERADAKVTKYQDNEVVIETNNPEDGFLVLTDSFYPTWHARIDGEQEIKVYRTDYNFRGIFVPKGKHVIRFYSSLL
ncbi:MAG: YfhO family protein [Patescibacteria group bacterium]